MYRSVVSQQGRVTLEADANEGEEIRAEASRETLIDVIGPAGAPGRGFEISVPPPTAGGRPFDFGIAAGDLYVGGMRIVQPSPTTYEAQKTSEWCDYPAGRPGVDPTPATQPPFDEVIYLSVTEQEVSAVEDRALREVALGGPDTAARTRLIQRVLRARATTERCEESFVRALTATPGIQVNPTTLRVTSSASLKAGVDPAAPPPEPCEPTAQSGFLGAENQLIRVQVTGDGSSLWGYDNASFLYRGVLQPDRKTIKLGGVPADVFHQPRPSQWVEVLEVAVDLGYDERIAAGHGLPFQIDEYDATANAIRLVGTTPAGVAGDVFVRVWEGQLGFVGNETTPTELTDAGGTGIGVFVYTKGTAVPGDYWMIGVRPGTPDEFLPARLHEFQPPDGPNRWAAPLATVHWVGQAEARVHNCRRPFDDLVELTRAKSCELVLHPGDEFQVLVDRQIKANTQEAIRGLHVRFDPGRFDLTAPLRLIGNRRGHLTVSGCGLSSQVVAATGVESAIVAERWDSVTVHDLAIAAGDAREGVHLGGALTILDTTVATVERVLAVCAGGPRRAATSLTIRNEAVRPATVATVRSCEFQVGANQTGVLLVNTAAATIEENRISLRGAATLPVVLTRRMLISNVRMGNSWAGLPAASRTGRTEVWLTLWGDDQYGDQYLVFVTDDELEDAWRAAFEPIVGDLELAGAGDITTEDRRSIQDFIERAVTQILGRSAAGPLNNAKMNEFRLAIALREATPREVAPAANHGVVVGGAIATDVRILHNMISGAMHGIRVGLSQERTGTPPPRRAEPVIAERVQIVGNSIQLVEPSDQGAPQAGIFVGNVEAATIRDNRIECERDDRFIDIRTSRRSEGIRVWGVAGGEDGHFLLITGNVSRGATIGIRVHQLGQPLGDTLVQITQNLAMACYDPVRVHGLHEVGVDNRP